MKRGAQYEQFVFDKLRRLCPFGVVKLNDKILGRESNINREIDVSVRQIVDDTTSVLYILQCRDRGRRADINTLGEFSSVIQDVGAAKGFLLCTSGFYKSNHRYALARGIELVTIEDIESDKWNVEVQIPFVYIRNMSNYLLSLGVTANAALVERNRDREITFNLATVRLRIGSESPSMTAEEFIRHRLTELGLQGREGVPLDLVHPTLEICFGDVWTPCHEFSVVFDKARKVRYLKYLTPSEYSQMRDHVRGTTLPLHVKLQGSLTLDNSFVEIPEGESTAFPGLWLEVEETTVTQA